MHELLDQLEQRVTERYMAAAAERDRLPDSPFSTLEFDSSEWWFSSRHLLGVAPDGPLLEIANAGPPTLQFPRQQWITYPNRRAVSLVIVDRALDQADTLTDDQWYQLTFLMFYGGRECL
ncbi:hypothetical protein BH11ACT6_BH11ACT6_34570 [soil metagenome]